MVFIACSTGLYGGFFIFRIAEPFVTPRPYVEAATLLAVLLLVSGRRGGSIAVPPRSALLHPLVALSGMLYWWLYHVIEDRRWCWLLVLGVVPAGPSCRHRTVFTTVSEFRPAVAGHPAATQRTSSSLRDGRISTWDCLPSISWL